MALVEGFGELETSSLLSEVNGSSESEELDPELEDVSESLELLLGCLSLSSSMVDETLGLFLLLSFGGNFLRVGAIWQWLRTDLMISKMSLLV